jgi:hypothetical protein
MLKAKGNGNRMKVRNVFKKIKCKENEFRSKEDAVTVKLR